MTLHRPESAPERPGGSSAVAGCPSCGHWRPDQNSPAEVDAFLDDDSTAACPFCCWLWTGLFVKVCCEEAAKL